MSISLRRRKRQDDEPKHQHLWVNDKCECGAERMTSQEFERRVAIWNKYYENVRETEAYQLFQAQRAAFKNRDMELVKKIAERQREKMEKRDFELVKPPFADPSLLYGKLEIKV